MKKNWIRRVIGGLSLTSMMFVFQACYGTPQDFGLDVHIEGLVKSKTTNLPIKGIKVSLGENMPYDYTREDGTFSFYTEQVPSINIKFTDIDSIENKSYKEIDTVLTDVEKRAYLEILLEEK